jgi:hypothetical protein
MDDIHRMAEEQVRGLENVGRKGAEETVQGRMTRFDVSQELARCLLDLEARIWELEMELKELKKRPT